MENLICGAGGKSGISLSGIFTYAGAGDDLYQSFVISADWQANKAFTIQTSIPYLWNSGEDKLTFMEYEANGIGDVRVTAWADITEWFFTDRITGEEDKKETEEEKDTPFPEEPLPGFLPDPRADLVEPPVKAEEEGKQEKDKRPHFRFGLGLKLPTGDHDVRDSAKMLLPTRFQPGWGVANLIAGLGYRQSFGEIRTNATFIYELSGGENSEDYKRGDILRFDTGAFYPLYEKYSLFGGFGYSLTWITAEDRLAGVKVKDTDGTFHSVNVVCAVTVYRGLSVSFNIRIPLNSTSSVSGNNVDFQYSLGLTYYF